MIAKFTATEASVYADEHSLATGVANGDRYLLFQRSLSGDDESRGVHLEYCSQPNSGYGKIATCRLSRSLLAVELTAPIDIEKKHEGFAIDLKVSDDQWAALAIGLSKIFCRHEEMLTVG